MLEALDTVSAMARDPRHNVYMDLEPGEMQFINNYHVLHGRTSYEDDAATGHKRHLKRLWLATNYLKDRPAHFRRNVRQSLDQEPLGQQDRGGRARVTRNGMPWNYGDVLEAVAAIVPAACPIYAHGDAVTTWGEAMPRMNNLARAMIAHGAKPKDKVAFYLRNCAEYTEALGACFLARLTHVNINYRYKPDEVRYILDNSDAQTLIYAHEFRDAVTQIHNQLPKVKTFIEVNGADVASFAENYETLSTKGDGSPLGIERSPDDQLFIYTGGTTGMPKGVIYQHGDLMQLWLNRVERLTGYMPPSIEAFCALVKMTSDGAARAARLSADARHRADGNAHLLSRRRLRGDGRRPHVRSGGSMGGGRDATRLLRSRSSAIRSRSPCCARSTRRQGATISRASPASHRQVRCSPKR